MLLKGLNQVMGNSLASKSPSSEAVLHEQITRYIRLHYGDVLFRSDYAAGLRMPMGQAIAQKRVQANRGYPDLTILRACRGYHGLMIELKKEGAAIYLRDGRLSSSPHLQRQLKVLRQLLEEGYYSAFAVGFEEAQALLDWYLGTNEKKNFREVPRASNNH